MQLNFFSVSVFNAMHICGFCFWRFRWKFVQMQICILNSEKKKKKKCKLRDPTLFCRGCLVFSLAKGIFVWNRIEKDSGYI